MSLREPRDSDDIMRELQELRNRITQLEQGRRDETGLTDYTAGTKFKGTTFSDSAGRYNFVSSKDKAGLVYPHLSAPFINPNHTFTLDSSLSSYTTVVTAKIYNPPADSIFFTVPINTGSTTLNMSWRLVDSNLTIIGSAATNGPITGNLNCTWIHNFAIGWSGSSSLSTNSFSLQVKYNSGAGTGTMAIPYGMHFTNQLFLQGFASSTDPLWVSG